MEIGTEILISLINMGVDNKKYFLRDIELEEQIQTINDKLYDLSECISNFSKLKSLIVDIKQSIINNIDILYKNAYDYEIKANYILKDIMNNIQNINDKDIIVEKTSFEDLDKFILTLDNKKQILLYKLKDILVNKNIEISIKDKSILIIKDEIIIANILIKTKIEIQFEILDKNNISFNGNYEKIKSNNIIVIQLLDKDEIWEIIDNRIQ